MTYKIAAFYLFTPLPDYKALQGPLFDTLYAAGVRGTVLLAEEGINGTITAAPENMDTALTALRKLPGCEKLQAKFSESEDAPFLRLKVRLKKEIVTLGIPSVDPTACVGTYVAPQDWNAFNVTVESIRTHDENVTFKLPRILSGE